MVWAAEISLNNCPCNVDCRCGIVALYYSSVNNNGRILWILGNTRGNNFDQVINVSTFKPLKAGWEIIFSNVNISQPLTDNYSNLLTIQ